VTSSTPAELDGVLAQVTDGAFVTTSDGTIVLWNDAATTILGCPAREALGSTCHALLGSGDALGNRLCREGCYASRRLETGELVQSFDIRTPGGNGCERWLNISAAAASDGNGGRLIVHLFREITTARQILDVLKHRRPPPDATSAAADMLTRRERDVLRVVATGARTKTVARELQMSPATVRNHVQKIMSKLGVHSRLQAVLHASRHGILQ